MGRGVNISVSCAFCGKPITTTGKHGMSCADRCADAWVRWHRLDNPNYQRHLQTLGKLTEALAEKAVLEARLFHPGTTTPRCEDQRMRVEGA